jgi:outer membrane lipase/esterase
MASRRQWHLSALSAIVGAVLLAACGGGESGPTTTRVVVFGDSLSDMGAYTPATQIPLGQAAGVPPFFGGKFTTNTHTGYSAASNSSTANTWGEWVAARLGIAVTPHEVGFGPQTVKCPAAANAALAGSCTGYAQGGSRVTNPAGIGNPNGTGLNGASPTPMTRPMVTQVADHLIRFTSFGSGDIVFVYGGNNDVFIQFGAVAQGLPLATAVANVQQVATELVALVKDQIVAKGATRVAVMTLADASATPGYRNLPDANKAVLAQLSAEFNTTLTAGLAGVAGVRIIDARTLAASVIASPASFGIVNVTDAACDPAKISAVTGGRVTDGSSLFCNAAPASLFIAPVPNFNGLKTGASASTWLFADSVHPTTAGHKIFADQVITQLKEFDWIPANQ